MDPILVATKAPTDSRIQEMDPILGETKAPMENQPILARSLPPSQLLASTSSFSLQTRQCQLDHWQIQVSNMAIAATVTATAGSMDHPPRVQGFANGMASIP